MTDQPVEPRPPRTVARFTAIEGLRAWLAWIVVIGHCVVGADLNEKWLPRQFEDAAPACVFVFVIVSGFVITHLIVEKNEPYAPYLTRRFLRIFPVFAVGCVIGYFTQQFYLDGLLKLSWHAPLIENIRALMADQQAYLPWHIAAHATMMHGAIPDQVLPSSTVTLLPPAWSLSLEWQFYLIAPFVIALVRKPLMPALLLVLASAGFVLFQHGKFGTFPSGGFLPGAAPLFALGIGTRLAWSNLHTSRPLTIALTALALAPVASTALLAALFWIAFTAFLCAEPNKLFGVERLAARGFRLAFESRPAMFWGERSYSVYLMHIPALSIAAFVLAGPTLTRATFFACLTGAGVILTSVIAICTYRFIEQPGIRLGRYLASRQPQFARPDRIDPR